MKTGRYWITLAIYVLVSWGAIYVRGLKPILLLGPTKSFTFVLDGIEGLSFPRTNIPDYEKYIWEGILIHLVCWILFPVLLAVLTRKNCLFGKAFLISFVASWVVGISVNWICEVLRTI